MKTSAVESEGREEAIATHAALRMQPSPVVSLGHFYQRLLDQNIWVSQAALAAGLGVSPGHVSKALQAARIPAQVICALGGADRVTFRIGDAVHTLIGLIGETAVIANAVRLRRSANLSTKEILEALTTGMPPTAPARRVRLSLGPRASYIRLESPLIKELASKMSELEDALNLALGMMGMTPKT